MATLRRLWHTAALTTILAAGILVAAQPVRPAQAFDPGLCGVFPYYTWPQCQQAALAPTATQNPFAAILQGPNGSSLLGTWANDPGIQQAVNVLNADPLANFDPAAATPDQIVQANDYCGYYPDAGTPKCAAIQAQAQQIMDQRMTANTNCPGLAPGDGTTPSDAYLRCALVAQNMPIVQGVLRTLNLAGNDWLGYQIGNQQQAWVQTASPQQLQQWYADGAVGATPFMLENGYAGLGYVDPTPPY